VDVPEKDLGGLNTCHYRDRGQILITTLTNRNFSSQI